MTSQRDVSKPMNAASQSVGTFPLRAAIARSSIPRMNKPAEHDEDRVADDGADARPVGVDKLFTQVYDRLKGMTSRQAAVRGATLQTTELVNELYLRMQRGGDLGFASPAQFFAYAARAMRHLLRDRARDRLRLHAGGGWERQTLDVEDDRLVVESAEEALALDEAMVALEQIDARAAQVVELRYFAGLSMEQMGEVLELNRRTLHRDWQFARAFLHARLR